MTDLEDKLAASVKKTAPVASKSKKAAPATKSKKTTEAKPASRKKPAAGSTSELHPRRIWPD